jgi:hypothetical protein
MLLRSGRGSRMPVDETLILVHTPDEFRIRLTKVSRMVCRRIYDSSWPPPPLRQAILRQRTL